MEEFPRHTLVTGASGLLGSHVLLACYQQGIPVKALARNTESAKQVFLELADYYEIKLNTTSFFPEFVEGDILDIPRLEELMEGIKKVIHTAALVSVLGSDRNRMQKTNVEGTANLVNIAMHNQIDWFCHVSSVATLGPNPDGLVDEDYFWKPGKHHSAYAISKYMAEQEVWRGQEEGLPVCVVNPSVIVGPAKENRSSAALIYRVIDGLPAYINGASGYVDVRDVSSAICKLLLRNETGKRIILSAENLETKDFLSLLSETLRVKVPEREAQPWLIGIARIASYLRSVFSSHKHQLTADAIKMARSKNRYDAGRSIEMGIQYRNIKHALQDFSKFYQNHSAK